MFEDIKKRIALHESAQEESMMLLEMVAEDDLSDIDEDVISPEEQKELDKIIDSLPEDIEDVEKITEEDIKATKNVANPTSKELTESLLSIFN